MTINPLPEIQPGEIYALVGETGSGHSELLHSLNDKNAELISFRHHFKNLSNRSDFYYQQRFNSFDSDDALTVRQHLDTAHSRHGHWTIDRAIEKLNLKPLLDEQVIKLSNGETKRVLIASALINNPPTLLLDHPLTGLDIQTRQNFDSLLHEISSSGTRIIIATNPWDVSVTVTHVAIMKNGQIIKTMKRQDFIPGDYDLTAEIKIDEKILRQLMANGNDMQFDNIVAMKNVSIEYDGRVILDRINWTVKPGERWALTGPNGAGKSTLLSLINGDNPQAYANDIVLFDRKRGSGESIWDIKHKTGFVSPELYQYFPTDSSCLHVIESGFYDTIGLFRQSQPALEQVCLNWMRLMQIEKYNHTLFYRVPSSVQRLTLLARALVKNPPLLILDEPTQGLDTHQQRFFTKLIEQICNISSTTLIYVSHYAEHIPSNVDKTIRLENGRRA